MSRGFKHDAAARELWGDAYEAIPKSVFATVAWFLAELCTENGGAVFRTMAEVEALHLNKLINDAQAKKALAALERLALSAKGGAA